MFTFAGLFLLVIFMNNKIVCVAKILSPHGVRGEVKLKCFMEDLDLFIDLANFFNKKQTHNFSLESLRGQKKDVFIASFDEIKNRNDAEKWVNTEIYIQRDELPEIEEDDEYYIEDLVNIKVIDKNSKPYGSIKAIHNFGAGDVIEILEESTSKRNLFPFTKEIITDVNIDQGFAVISLPEFEYAQDNTEQTKKEK